MSLSVRSINWSSMDCNRFSTPRKQLGARLFTVFAGSAALRHGRSRLSGRIDEFSTNCIRPLAGLVVCGYTARALGQSRRA